MYSYSLNKFPGGDVFKLAGFFSHRLADFFVPLLLQLDELLDKRLVSTFAGLCQSIIRLRGRSTGLLLSELGGYLLSFDKAPAGTKRISNLLRSPKWEDRIITDYLASKARQYKAVYRKTAGTAKGYSTSLG